ncbi:hypothetical protein DFA_04851 [Cavenderia fasciculata]|uniref:A-kinase anchor protein 7-like phosphoesterase domain-containing protein n=1 Tax=Cavenderia fasciculata TaxID=261658 RepID=F4PM18_CACFS|nr:uncharacterized protein DFA_04851 [Cavenderia fasciculata]EGG22721.1 hypothetical protein DFA_04851 [Cavenderia fasciculata]|eukprot:XP_004360572.1 hypothetical protein DFA_04851 [Cavenderia fasciculata]
MGRSKVASNTDQVSHYPYSKALLNCELYSGTGTFSESFIWAGVKQDEMKSKLEQFYQMSFKLFKDNNINVHKEPKWIPHITLLKDNRLHNKQYFQQAIQISNAFNSSYFGDQTFGRLDFMKVGSKDRKTGYYEIVDSIKLVDS